MRSPTHCSIPRIALYSVARALRLARALRPLVRAPASAGPEFPNAAQSTVAPHGARLAGLPPRAQHAALELLRGTMDRHSFIAYRDDRERDAQPITFEGDAWRGFVPVRLPWTLTIKDRAPRGVPPCSSILVTCIPILRSSIPRRSGANPDRDRWRALRSPDPGKRPDER